MFKNRISNPKSTLYFENKWVIKMKGEEKRGGRNVPFFFFNPYCFWA